MHGFTLAEVLITLGIIGVVAALTIPTLIQDHNTRVWNTSAGVFEKKLEEALKVMNTQLTLAGHTTTESFVEELSKHFKVNKVCDNNHLPECFIDTISDVNVAVELTTATSTTELSDTLDMTSLKTAADLGKKNWDSNTMGLQFANGVTAVLAYNNHDCKQDPYSNQVDVKSCVSMIYDTSGWKSPNSNNKDVRMYNVDLAGACLFKVNGTCYGKPYKVPVKYLSYDECMAIKNDGYGDFTCTSSVGYTDNNIVALVAKHCEAFDNIIDQEEIDKHLVKYICMRDNVNDPISGPSCKASEERLNSLGLSLGDAIVTLDGPNQVSYRVYTNSGFISRSSPFFRFADGYTFCKIQ